MSSSFLQPTNKNAQTDASYFLPSLRVFSPNVAQWRDPVSLARASKVHHLGDDFAEDFRTLHPTGDLASVSNRHFEAFQQKNTGILWDEHIGEDVFFIIRCVPHPTTNWILVYPLHQGGAIFGDQALVMHAPLMPLAFGSDLLPGNCRHQSPSLRPRHVCFFSVGPDQWKPIKHRGSEKKGAQIVWLWSGCQLWKDWIPNLWLWSILIEHEKCYTLKLKLWLRNQRL